MMLKEVHLHFWWLIPVGSMVLTLLLWGCCIVLARMRDQRMHPEAPRASKGPAGVEPEPGRMETDRLRQVRDARLLVLLTPLVFLSAHGMLFLHDETGVELAAAFGLVGGGGLWSYGIVRWRVARRELREARWAAAARATVAAAVDRIRGDVQTIFSDVVVEGGTIDFLVVDTKGLFVLYAPTPPRPDEGHEPGGATVIYDGRVLRFPRLTDETTVPLTEGLAEQISIKCSGQLSIPVAARAVLVLPGWQIKRVAAHGISVIHPDRLAAFFQYVKSRPLGPREIAQITGLLERTGAASPDNPTPCP